MVHAQTTHIIPSHMWASKHYCILSGHLDLTCALQLSRRNSITFKSLPALSISSLVSYMPLHVKITPSRHKWKYNLVHTVYIMGCRAKWHPGADIISVASVHYDTVHSWHLLQQFSLLPLNMWVIHVRLISHYCLISLFVWRNILRKAVYYLDSMYRCSYYS